MADYECGVRSVRTSLLRLTIDRRTLAGDPSLLLLQPLLWRHPARQLIPSVGRVRVRHRLGALLFERGVGGCRRETGRGVSGMIEVLGVVRVTERVAGVVLLARDDLARKLALAVGGIRWETG